MRIKGGIWRVLGLPKPYGIGDFESRERLRDDYLLVGGALADLFDFDSVLDVGCGNGFLLEELQRRGKSVSGIERSRAVRKVLAPEIADKIRIGDFRTATGSWDLVCCVEVAEHIRPAVSERLVSTLARVAKRWIYFTAAPPGQGGRGHINCRPAAWWVGAFAEEGWSLDPEMTGAVKLRLEALREATWLGENSMVFRRDRDGQVLAQA